MFWKNYCSSLFTNMFLMPLLNLTKNETFTESPSFWSWVCKTSKAHFLQAFALKEKCERAFSLAGRNHVTELSTVVHVIRKCRRKGTFNFTKIENNHEFRREKVCHMKRFFFLFFLWNYTYSFKNIFKVIPYAA